MWNVFCVIKKTNQLQDEKIPSLTLCSFLVSSFSCSVILALNVAIQQTFLTIFSAVHDCHNLMVSTSPRRCFKKERRVLILGIKGVKRMESYVFQVWLADPLHYLLVHPQHYCRQPLGICRSEMAEGGGWLKWRWLP